VLRGDVDLPDELAAARNHRAEGVGLLRTEFLIMGHSALPSEDDQTEYFRRVGQAFPGHPVVIRTYDLGGDKLPAPFRTQPEPNPQLGWRAIRVCLDRPEIFRTQVRAALRGWPTASTRTIRACYACSRWWPTPRAPRESPRVCAAKWRPSRFRLSC